VGGYSKNEARLLQKMIAFLGEGEREREREIAESKFALYLTIVANYIIHPA